MRAVARASLTLFAVAASASSAVAQEPPPAYPAEAFRVEFVTTFWQPDPSLTIQTGELTGAGITDFDFADEFNLENERFTEFRLVFKPGTRHKIRFAYVPIRYDQTATLVRPILFNGRTYSGSAALDMKWNLWQFGYEWDFVRHERGFFGMLAELRYNDIRGIIRSAGRSDSTDVKAPVPTVGVIGRGYLHRNVAVSGELSGLKIPGDSFDATFVDIDISATASLSRHFGVQGGYRAVMADYVVDEDSGDLKVKGLYFGLVSRF